MGKGITFGMLINKITNKRKKRKEKKRKEKKENLVKTSNDNDKVNCFNFHLLFS
jgi:protein subunit release factor A